MERTIFIIKLGEIISGISRQEALKEPKSLKRKIDKYKELKTLLQKISKDGHYIAIILPSNDFDLDRVGYVFDSLFPNIDQKDFFDQLDLDKIVKSFNSKYTMDTMEKNNKNRIVLISNQKNDNNLTQLAIAVEQYKEMKEDAEDKENDVVYIRPKKKFWQRRSVMLSVGGMLCFIALGILVGIILEMTGLYTFPEGIPVAAIIGGVGGFTLGGGVVGGVNLIKHCKDYHKPMFSSVDDDLSDENSAMLRDKARQKNYDATEDKGDFAPSPVPSFTHLVETQKTTPLSKKDPTTDKEIRIINLSEAEATQRGKTNNLV